MIKFIKINAEKEREEQAAKFKAQITDLNS